MDSKKEEQFILIVDDEPSFVSQFKTYLETKGFHVLAAGSGEEAIGLLKKYPVAVAVADQRMPGIKGVGLLAKIQQDYPEVIRVLITGYSDMEVVIDAVNKGSIYRYVSKGLLPEEIALVIKQCLDKYNREREVLQLYRANKRLLRKLSAEENLSTVGIFGREVSRKLEEVVLGLSGYLFKQAGHGDVESLKRDFIRLHASIERIRELSLLSEDLREVKPSQPINPLLTEEAEKVVQLSRIKGNPFKFELDLEKNAESLLIPSVHFKRLIKELFENAVLFSPDRSGLITIRTRTFGEKEDPRIELDILNRALPPPVDPSSLFAPFYTSLNPLSDAEGPVEGRPGDYNLTHANHLGMGLPIARWIASRLGGELFLLYGDEHMKARVSLPLNKDSYAP